METKDQLSDIETKLTEMTEKLEARNKTIREMQVGAIEWTRFVEMQLGKYRYRERHREMMMTMMMMMAAVEG